jgi:hypothetical protein
LRLCAGCSSYDQRTLVRWEFAAATVLAGDDEDRGPLDQGVRGSADLRLFVKVTLSLVMLTLVPAVSFAAEAGCAVKEGVRWKRTV